MDQQNTLEKMRIENSVQLKEQDIKHLRDQLLDKKEQMSKMKAEQESKVRHLEGSKSKLLKGLRDDFQQEKSRLKTSFEHKKRTLKEKVLNLTSIVSQKEQEIDSHLSNIKISHKGNSYMAKLIIRVDEGERKTWIGAETF